MARNFGEYPLTKEAISERDLVNPCYQSAEADLKSLKARLTSINPVVDEAGHLVLINPNAGDLLPVRAWPVENYAALTRRIIERFNAVVIVTRWEIGDRMLAKTAGFHGFLPTVNLVQRLVTRFLREDYKGHVWGWKPPTVQKGKWLPPNWLEKRFK